MSAIVKCGCCGSSMRRPTVEYVSGGLNAQENIRAVQAEWPHLGTSIGNDYLFVAKQGGKLTGFGTISVGPRGLLYVSKLDVVHYLEETEAIFDILDEMLAFFRKELDAPLLYLAEADEAGAEVLKESRGAIDIRSDFKIPVINHLESEQPHIVAFANTIKRPR